MAVKKHKLSTEAVADITIIGITTSLNDYRLAYFLNKVIPLRLERFDDLPVFNEKTKLHRFYSIYSCYDADQRLSFYLISNEHPDGKMIDQYNQANYFLFIKGSTSNIDYKLIQSTIRKIPSVTFVFLPETQKIKELEGILQDLELHEIEQQKVLTKKNPVL